MWSNGLIQLLQQQKTDWAVLQSLLTEVTKLQKNGYCLKFTLCLQTEIFHDEMIALETSRICILTYITHAALYNSYTCIIKG